MLRTWKTYQVAKGVRGTELIHKLRFASAALSILVGLQATQLAKALNIYSAMRNREEKNVFIS